MRVELDGALSLPHRTGGPKAALQPLHQQTIVGHLLAAGGGGVHHEQLHTTRLGGVREPYGPVRVELDVALSLPHRTGGPGAALDPAPAASRRALSTRRPPRTQSHTVYVARRGDGSGRRA